MPAIAGLTWSLQRDGTCRVSSPWWEFLWHPVGGLTQLRFGPGTWRVPAILGLGFIRTRQQSWLLDQHTPSDIVIQENRITASWLVSPQRPIELHARWTLEGCRFWLEISLLTPTRLKGLCLETRTQLGDCLSADSPTVHPDVLVAKLHPRAVPDWVYLELAHRPEAFDVLTELGGLVSFRLFNEDLEKGVVLRSRLLATFLRRDRESELVQRLAQEFAQAPPNLSR